MKINRARLCQRTAIWIAAVGLGPMSVPAAAEEKAAFPVATPESQGVSAAAVRRVAGEVEEYVKDGTIVGGELLIIKNRRTILHEAYGARDREAARGRCRGRQRRVHGGRRCAAAARGADAGRVTHKARPIASKSCFVVLLQLKCPVPTIREYKIHSKVAYRC